MTAHRLNHHDIQRLDDTQARERAERRAHFAVAAASLMAALSLLAMAVSGALT